MNDGQYTNIRNYLEELASQGKQLLAAQQRTNELLEQLSASKAKGATSEFVEGTDKPAVPRRQDAPVEGLAAMGTMTEPKPDSPHGMGGKKPGKSK